MSRGHDAVRGRRASACATPGSRDEGQILLLSLVFALVTITLVLVVASASAVHIERKRLVALADSAAVAASDAISESRYYLGDGPGDGGGGAAVPTGTFVPLTDQTVGAAVTDYLTRAPAAVTGEFAQLRVGDPTGSPDGFTAQVTLTAVAAPPLVPWVLVPWSDGITVRVTASARAG